VDRTDPERLLFAVPGASITLCDIQSCAIVDDLQERIKKDEEIICQVYPSRNAEWETKSRYALTTRIINSDGRTVPPNFFAKKKKFGCRGLQTIRIGWFCRSAWN